MKELLSWILGVVGLALLAFALRPLLWGAVNKKVFAWMDARLLTPFWVKLHPGERLEMVAKQSPIIVYEKLVIRGLLGAGAGLLVGGVLAILWTIYQGVSNITAYLNGNGFGPFQWFASAVVGAVIVCVPVLLYTWFVEKWNQEHFRYVITTSTAWAAAILAPWGKPFISSGATTELREMFVSRDPKAPRERKIKKAWWQKAYEGWLWRRRGIDDVFLPSRLFGAADTWRRVPWAAGRLKILIHIRGRGEEWFEARGVAMNRFYNTRLDEALTDGGWVSMGEAQEVLTAHNRVVGDASPEKINVLTVEDPRIYNAEDWHRGVGEVGGVVAARPTALDLSAFPAFPE